MKLEISHPDKLLFLSHIKGRPVSMQRFPRRFAGKSSRLLIHFVALGAFDVVGLDVLLWMGLARAAAARIRVAVLGEWIAVRRGGIAWILPLLVWIWPLRRVRFIRRIVQRVMRSRIGGTVAGEPLRVLQFRVAHDRVGAGVLGV